MWCILNSLTAKRHGSTGRLHESMEAKGTGFGVKRGSDSSAKVYLWVWNVHRKGIEMGAEKLAEIDPSVQTMEESNA